MATLVEIVREHVSSMSRDDMEKVQDGVWSLFCQHLINIRNDCDKVTSAYIKELGLIVIIIIIYLLWRSYDLA